MKSKMYHEHQPFKCPSCGSVTNSLNVHDIYDTEAGDGIYDVFTPCCDYKLKYEEIDQVGIMDNKGWKYE